MQREEIDMKIWQLKNSLAETDYKAMKFIEGEISEEDFAPIKQKRKNWRNEINNLENLLKNC